MLSLVISAPLREELFRLAADGIPEEVCGVLSGGVQGDRGDVLEVLPCRNVDPAPQIAYMLDPQEQLSALQRIETTPGRELVGFYHSHPEGPCQLSLVDALRASWPKAFYVLIDLSGDAPALRAWYFRGEAGGFEPAEVVVAASEG